MFGLRWITAVSLKHHTRPDCPGLAPARAQGWRPYLIAPGYGRDFYEPCKRCH
jgi:hypothetical protein